MISTPVLQILIGLAAAYMAVGPQLFGVAKRFFAKPAPQPGVPELTTDENIVDLLAALISIRRQVKEDPKAVEAIDTLIVPAILRSEDKANES